MSFMTNADIPVRSIRFDTERFSAARYFSPEVLERIQVRRGDGIEREVSIMLDGLVAKWTEDRILQVPANWWEHFKQRWFPAWALERWPVLMKTYDAAVILPMVPISDPKFHRVEFAVWRENDG